jgi:Integrase core domain
VLRAQHFESLLQAQGRFDAWRHCYNHERPHEAWGLQTPATRYHASPRAFPEVLPAIEYADAENVHTVQHGGEIHYQGRVLKVSKAFHRYPVAVRQNAVHDGLIEVFFAHQKIASLNLRELVVN